MHIDLIFLTGHLVARDLRTLDGAAAILLAFGLHEALPGVLRQLILSNPKEELCSPPDTKNICDEFQYVLEKEISCSECPLWDASMCCHCLLGDQ